MEKIIYPFINKPITGLIIAVWFLCAATGCQSQRVEMELQQENQALERQIHENYAFMQHQQRRIADLETQNAQSQAKAEAVNSQPTTGRTYRSSTSGTGNSPTSPQRLWLDPNSGAPAPTASPNPGSDASPLEDINADPNGNPRVTVPNKPTQTVPRGLFRQNDNSQSSLPPALPELGSLPVVNVSDLAEISIDPEQIGPLQINPQSGEEGLRMVLNCRTKQGATAVSAGKVTIVALDPNQEGEAARIARWDVSESQLKQLITEAPQPDGVLFELAWPKNKPTSDALDVFVRLEDNLGNKLQTRQQVQMNTPKYTLWQPPTGEALPDSEIASDDNLPDPQSPLTFKEEENPLQQGEIYKSEIVVAAPQIDALRNRSRQQINPIMVDNQRVAPVNWEQSSRTDENNANRSSSGAVVGLPENHTENSNSPAASTAGRPTWSPYR